MSQKEIKSRMEEIKVKIAPLIQERKSLQNDIDVILKNIVKFKKISFVFLINLGNE